MSSVSYPVLTYFAVYLRYKLMYCLTKAPTQKMYYFLHTDFSLMCLKDTVEKYHPFKDSNLKGCLLYFSVLYYAKLMKIYICIFIIVE